jgi:glyoxylase-like metal-dependent hydrolase (beta-lactamase superfamily II)
MSTLDFKIFDLDFPVGSKNKTAALVIGENEALLVDAGFTRADGHRLAAEILDSGKQLTTVFISHGDPDFYQEPLSGAFIAASAGSCRSRPQLAAGTDR